MLRSAPSSPSSLHLQLDDDMEAPKELLVASNPAPPRSHETSVTVSTATIQHLMPDVLCEIFRRSLPSDLSKPLSGVAPFNLSTVCKSWRDVVLDRPSLWSSMKLIVRHQNCSSNTTEETCSDPIHTSCGRLLRSWERWLELSGDTPLEIHCDLQDLGGITSAPLAEIVQMTFEQQHRWRICFLQLILKEESSKFSEIDHALRFQPHLERLTISLLNERMTRANGVCNVELFSAPRLSRVIIPVARTIITQPITHLGSLEMLILFQISPSALIDITINAPNLRLVVAGIFGEFVDEGATSKVVLSKLKQLHLIRFDITSLPYLLKRLSVPSLVTFQLQSAFKVEPLALNMWTALRECMERSRPPLEELSLQARAANPYLRIRSKPRDDMSPLSDDTLIGMLRGLPSLKKLEVAGTIASSRLFNALTRDRENADADVLCPLLQHITQKKDGHDHFEFEQIQGRQEVVSLGT